MCPPDPNPLIRRELLVAGIASARMAQRETAVKLAPRRHGVSRCMEK